MEEILASIRRIIADDQEVLRGASRDRGEPSGLANVLDLTERQTAQMMGRSSPLGQGYPAPEPHRDSTDHGDEDDHSDNDLQLVSYHDEPEDALDRVPEPDEAERTFSDPRRTDTLLSSAANASVADAFTRLGSTIMPTQPQTLEDLMKDLLRPMLKEWLDDNLPALVERLVQAEIERIARRR
jgi:cell pole-organizing protein PopZ